MNLLCSVLTYHVRIIITLGSDRQLYYRLKARYCARQHPKAMKHGPFFKNWRHFQELGPRTCVVSVWTWGGVNGRIVSGSRLRLWSQTDLGLDPESATF